MNERRMDMARRTAEMALERSPLPMAQWVVLVKIKGNEYDARTVERVKFIEIAEQRIADNDPEGSDLKRMLEAIYAHSDSIPEIFLFDDEPRPLMSFVYIIPQNAPGGSA